MSIFPRMNIWTTAVAGLLASLSPASAEDRIYTGAQVWTGEGFEQLDFAERDGVFIPLDQVEADAERVDLEGRFAVPPYANAHHHITNANDESSWYFLNAGVYYVWNPNTIITGDRDDNAAYFARPDSYDVRESMGGITEPLGHPERLYVEILTRWVYQCWEREDFIGNAFHYGRNEAEIDAALDLLVSQGATFVKSYLLFSEEFELRRGNEEYYGEAGLDPALMPYLVEAAHARGLPVAVHVQTRQDAVTAARAGADMLGHLPAYGAEREIGDVAATRLTAEDAELIAEAGMLLVPTYALARSSFARQAGEGNLDEALRDAVYAAQASNLRLLQAAGARILTGTDGPYAVNEEVAHWVDIGGLSQDEALAAMWNTPQYLFPERRIGRIEPGFEASFLVLDSDPREDFSNLLDIGLRRKQGLTLTPPPAE